MNSPGGKTPHLSIYLSIYLLTYSFTTTPALGLPREAFKIDLLTHLLDIYRTHDA